VIGPDFLTQLPSLGISGLLFVMWWMERQERARAGSGLCTALEYAARVAEINRHLLDVIRANTEALTALREELRTHRASEAEWLTRLDTRLAELTCP
jgi:hypothetical protein